MQLLFKFDPLFQVQANNSADLMKSHGVVLSGAADRILSTKIVYPYHQSVKLELLAADSDLGFNDGTDLVEVFCRIASFGFVECQLGLLIPYFMHVTEHGGIREPVVIYMPSTVKSPNVLMCKIYNKKWNVIADDTAFLRYWSYHSRFLVAAL